MLFGQSDFKKGGTPKKLPQEHLFHGTGETVLENIIKEDNWNELRIIANGPEIEIFINGISTVKYLEKEKWIPREGHICLQAHSGGPYEILYKDIRLKKL